MRTFGEADLLAWAESRAMGVDRRYPASAILTFRPDSGHDRYWCVPPKPERRPYFIASLLDLLGEWNSCFVWKALGSWPASAIPQRTNDVVHLRILKGLGLPLGTADAVEFSRPEIDSLVTLLFLTTIFGWSVGDDMYVIPDNGRYIMKTDHHDVIHVSFRDTEDLDRLVEAMAGRGFALSDDLPDETFKPAPWMKGE
jgi:hypothetical protein